MRIGIIDLGSNSARLAIYEIKENGSYRPCYRMKKNIQLAQYIDDEGRISSAGIQKAVVSVTAFRNVGQLYNVEHWLAAGTAAIRQAKNGTDVLKILKEETGVSFRVLSGQEEAWYVYLGVLNTMDIEDAILVDIGGASTEITHVHNRDFINAVSLPYGALTLSKKFSHLEIPDQVESIFQFMKSEMLNISWLRQLNGLPIIGTGGTARAIGKISEHTHRSQVNRLDGSEIDQTVLQQMYEQLKSINVKERKQLGKISDSRAQIIHAGVAAVWALTNTTSANSFLVNGNGLREGLFYEYLFNDKTSPVLRSVKEHSIHNLMQLFDVPMEVARRVAQQAEILFDQLKPLHKLNSKHRELMRTAVLLEMTGAYVNVERYRAHTDYLIRSSHLHGFTQEEMVNISRVIIGSGQKPFRQLNLIIQLAKTSVYEVGEDNISLQVDKNELTVRCSEKSQNEMNAVLESLRKDFFKQFGIRMKKSASQYIEDQDAF